MIKIFKNLGSFWGHFSPFSAQNCANENFCWNSSPMSFRKILHSCIKSEKKTSNKPLPRKTHCVKSIQVRSFFSSVFSRGWTEYGKIRTRKNSVSGHFLRSNCKQTHGHKGRRTYGQNRSSHGSNKQYKVTFFFIYLRKNTLRQSHFSLPCHLY